MAQRRGRPKNDEYRDDSKKKLTDAAVELIREGGAGSVTVRNVVKRSGLSTGTFYHYFENKDDLLMYFVKTDYFCKCRLKSDLEHISERISELYTKLTDRYMELGIDFMKSFYTTENKALSAYMSEKNGCFLPDTVMYRCEREIIKAIKMGVLKPDSDAHLMSIDICTIVKGCVFEWCLSGSADGPGESISRILDKYFQPYLSL